MSYNSTKMKRLLEVDHFLHDTVEDMKGIIGCEQKAMEVVFHTYILREPILKNAYDHLT
ncbi:hypothetical protein [Bacillus alkalicellulosilyticus]|uniref:hypothetical protein n=1 Tax=Alkalihalobacterium alkalicellulosilyticum TaxID=1912214 RepID=UPI001483B567|nr:hypothetical protein [Bacillus alkalicellulosilyticus]